MKLSITSLLLCVGSFCLFQGCTARAATRYPGQPLGLRQPLEVNAEEDEVIYSRALFVEPQKDYVVPEPYAEKHEELPVPPNIVISSAGEKENYLKSDYNDEEQEEMPVPRNIVIASMDGEEQQEIPVPRSIVIPTLDGKGDLAQPKPFADEQEEVPVPRNIVMPTLDEEENFVEPEADENGVPEGRASECKVTIRGGLPKPQPVYLETNKASFYPYDSTGVMVVDSGKTLEMWCPGQFTNFAKTLVTATCVSGTTFRVDGTSYSFKELTCKSWPGFVAQKTGASCNGGKMVRVGFKISSTRFAEEMQICFNEDEEVTRYVKHNLNPGSNYYETGVERITFQTGGFFGGKNVDKLYTQATQKQTIGNQLGSDSDKYFNSNQNIYLARGHMGAKADFDYGTQQRATFLFINAAPQWQVFNAGNWQRVEDGVRAFVSKKKINVECYTGVWGVTTLPNSKGVQTPLYLAYDNNNNGQIPVPKIYFRVVIEPATKKGIVLVGVNNPHLTLEQIKRDYILCNDVSSQVTYINWKKTDITAGYSYACEVSEFRKKVTNLPALSAPGGLLL